MKRKSLFSLVIVLVLLFSLTPIVFAQEGDIVDTAVNTEGFSTLVAAVQAAGLEDALRSEGPFTVFAPTDDAFAALPEGAIDELLADPAGDLTQILLYHVVPGKVMAADVTDGLEAETLQGGVLTFAVADDGSVTVNGVNVIATDVGTTNGVIHVIDGVLLPPAAEEAEAAEAEATPAAEEEAAEAEATPAPAEEMAGETKGGMAGETKGGMAPETMPATGASLPSNASGMGVVLVVLAVVFGGAVIARRRNLE